MQTTEHGGTGTTATGRPYLILMREGPSFSADEVKPMCEALGRRFVGELWTYGTYDLDTQVNGFRLRVIRTRQNSRRFSYLRYMRHARRHARELARAGVQDVVVMSYDPFKNGLLARMIATIVGGRFICEVNGSYANPDNFADEPSRLKRRARLWAMRVMARFVIRRADGVRLLFDQALDGLCQPRPGTVVRRFTNLAFLQRFYSSPEENFILLAGYPFYRKGADLLCRAFLQIADAHPDWRLVLIGHELLEGARGIGVTHERIQFHKSMPQSDLAAWMARCAIVAQPSRSEAMGRILLEAAAAGKCRIGSDVEGIPTTITDGIDGVLVRNKDVGHLAQTLAALMSDPERRARLGAAARRRAETEFSTETYLRNLCELIDRVRKQPQAERDDRIAEFRSIP